MNRLRQLFLIGIGIAFVRVVGTGYAGTTGGETIVVTTVEDSVDFPQPRTVTELPGPDGRVSFREAVTAANNTPGPQTIAFAIPQSEFWLITNIALLKLENGIFNLIDNGTAVDFSTQTAFTGDTNPDGSEVGIYGLEPNGWGAGAIYINGNNCVIRGLGVVQQRGYAVYIRGNDNRVVGSTISGPFYAAVYITGGFGGPTASRNIVGGTAPGEGNTLSAGNSGVRIDGPAAENVVIGNLRLSGSFYGVEVRSAPSSNLFAVNNRIGGPTVAERNLIAGAGKFGEEGFPTGAQVSLQDASGTIVQGNFIGTNAAGTASFGQRGPAGVSARNSTGTQILDNLISGILVVGVNHYAGQRFGTAISLQGDNAGTVVQGNYIGTDVSGQNAIPNRAGISTSFWPGSATPSAVTIGGIEEGEGNRIAFNETIGISVYSDADGIQISGNSIDSNGALGIDLFSESGGGGVTPNDPGDADDGGNGLQNFPVLQSAVVGAGGTTVTGTLNSLPNSQFSLEFFASPQCDPSGFGEGATFLGSLTVTTDSSGNTPFQAVVSSAPVGSAITATATQLSTGNTSEFSACQTATGSGAPALQLVSAVSRKQHGGMGNFDVNLPISGAPAVECRSSGGNHVFVFTFNNNVVSGGANIGNGVGTPSSPVFSGNTMTVNLTGVADAQRLTLVLSNITDQFSQVLPETAVSVKILIGDTNGNGVVNASDVAQAKAQSGNLMLDTNFRADANINGAINATDIGMIKSKAGNAVP
jgi:hypothetical protein